MAERTRLTNDERLALVDCLLWDASLLSAVAEELRDAALTDAEHPGGYPNTWEAVFEAALVGDPSAALALAERGLGKEWLERTRRWVEAGAEAIAAEAEEAARGA